VSQHDDSPPVLSQDIRTRLSSQEEKITNQVWYNKIMGKCFKCGGYTRNPRIKRGDLLEICQRCPGCGTQHPCGDDSCKHDYGFALKDSEGNQVLAWLLLREESVPLSDIVASGWTGWVPEEIQHPYDEWMTRNAWQEDWEEREEDDVHRCEACSGNLEPSDLSLIVPGTNIQLLGGTFSCFKGKVLDRLLAQGREMIIIELKIFGKLTPVPFYVVGSHQLAVRPGSTEHAFGVSVV
jgi:hypothetical protein